MTEQDKPDRREEYKDQSAAKLAHEVLRLLLVLVWRIILWCIKKVCKGLLWCLDITEKGWDRLNVWWHDNDTQAKVAKIKAGEVIISFGEKDEAAISRLAGEKIKEIIEARLLRGDLLKNEVQDFTRYLEEKNNIFLP